MIPTPSSSSLVKPASLPGKIVLAPKIPAKSKPLIPVLLHPPPAKPPIPTLLPPTTGSFGASFSYFPKAVTSTANVEQRNTPFAKRKADSEAEDSSESNKKTKIVLMDDIARQFFYKVGLRDPFFTSGKVRAWALEPDDEAFKNIQQYVTQSQEKFGVKILTILGVVANANGEANANYVQAPLDFDADPTTKGKQRMMLWYATRPNLISLILETGVMLPSRRYNFRGEDAHFTDRVSAAWRWHFFTFKPKAGKIAYLFLCDVVLGEIYEPEDYSWWYLKWKTAPTIYGLTGGRKCDSIKLCGVNIPDKEGNKIIDGCLWPLGTSVPNKEDTPPFASWNNDYAVFSSAQVRPKYLLKVEITENPVV